MVSVDHAGAVVLMRHSEALDLIGPEWVKALNELTDITRDSEANAGTYKYKYSTLDQATKQAREVLGKHDIAVHQSAQGDSLGSVSIATRAWHSSGQWIEAEPLTMPAKGGPQDVGSAISYGRRYALMAFLGLATDDDDAAGAQAAAKEADKPHPLSDRVVAVVADVKRMSDTTRAECNSFADGRPLTHGALLRDEGWLTELENWIDAKKQAKAKP